MTPDLVLFFDGVAGKLVTVLDLNSLRHGQVSSFIATSIPTLVLLLLATLSGVAFYRIYLSPLAKFPGPRLWAMTRLPWAYHQVRGNIHTKIEKLHEKYGPVVRVAPTELSFITLESYNDIFLKPHGKPELAKDPHCFVDVENDAKRLLWPSSDKDHSRLRRNFARAFSEGSLREQEPIIVKYVDLLISKFRETAGTPQDVCIWFNFLVFDMIGELALGESFRCLETSTIHPWAAMFDWVVGVAIVGCFQRFQPLGKILVSMVPKQFRDAAGEHRDESFKRLQKRLADPMPRQDFLTSVIPKLSTPAGLTIDELHECVRIIIAAGSETTATALSGTTYFLLSNPSILSKLQAEIRSTFARDEDMCVSSLTALQLPYLHAVINESLRLFPPGPMNMGRMTPPGGHMVSGFFVPGNTIVSPNPYAAFRSPLNFHRPTEFIPERWLEPGLRPSAFDGDNRAVCMPFSAGPRNCIGKALATMEMKLVLAKMVWRFEMSLEEECRGWMDKEGMRVYIVWRKPALMVRFREREGVC